jgi:hypothetical protein
MVVPMNAAYAKAPSLDVAFFAETDLLGREEEAQEACQHCDLVISLGNVDLVRLARLMPSDRAALCVLGEDDAEAQPPAPFRPLHGGGVTFRDWRIGGLSGALRQGPGLGFYIDEGEALGFLTGLPSCDLLISYLPPASVDARRGLQALDDFLLAKEPIYHFHAQHEQGDSDCLRGDPDRPTWVVGVNGFLHPQPLQFV